MKKTLKQTRVHLILVGIIALASSIVYSLVAFFMMRLIDYALSGQMDLVLDNAKLLFGIILLEIPFSFLKVQAKTHYIKKTMTLLKDTYLSSLFKKDINEFQAENNGLYLSNLTNDMDTIERKYANSMVELINRSIDFVVALLLVAYIQPLILFLALVFAGMIVVFSTLLGKPLQKPEKEKSERLAAYTQYVREILSAFAIVKNNNLEKHISTNFKEHSKSVQDKNYEIDVKLTYINALQSIIIFAVLIGGLATVIYLSHRYSLLTAGGVMLIFTSFGRLINPIFQMIEIIPNLTSVNLLFKEIDKNLENQSEWIETLPLDTIESGLSFKDVAFDYGENLVFKNVNIDFEVGKKYLIIGPSGQGKSTLLKLLRKYFALSEGSILIDDQNYLDTKKMDVFKHLANIEQQVFLFEDTLKNNITLYKDYTDQKIWDAINKSGLGDVAKEFSLGLDHMIVDNGKNISGGQKARVAIARGLITDAKIILLDEAFASLDETVAKQIEQTLLNLEDVMLINVSHVIFKESMSQYDEVYVVNQQQILPYTL